MIQILQNLSTGETALVDVPAPSVGPNDVLISAVCSLISPGTERMLMEFGKSNLINKARQQPEKVKEVLVKARTDGVLATYDAVKSKLNQPIPLGYCHVGIVIDKGENVSNIEVGDRVASNGSHSSVVSVPKNLVAKIPLEVSDEEAAFTVLGAIALQGVRLVEPTLGETVAVIGLGVIGLVTVQLLKANGCRVIGFDFDEDKVNLAKAYGAECHTLGHGADPVALGNSFSRGRGVDAVILSASTKSNDPISQAAQMCRKRGRVVLVGVVGLDINRADFFEKEISFQVSCSYGPGRYDPVYEERGQDYPIGFVRWTENRNLEAILDLLAEGKLEVSSLVTDRFDFSQAGSAYKLLSDGAGNKAIGILLEYEHEKTQETKSTVSRTVHLKAFNASASPQVPVCAFIGAGNYASRVLIPAFKESGAQLHTLVSKGGVSAAHHGGKNGFAYASTDVNEVISSREINTVVIATRHNTHAELVIDALASNKNVFVEKPLAITNAELSSIETTYKKMLAEDKTPRLMVGFNRRFAPHSVKLKSLLNRVSEPKVFIITVNAGSIPPDSWVQDVTIGGGRIIGECCHFVDLMRFLAGSPIVSVQARCVGKDSGVAVSADKSTIVLEFEDGSHGTIHYLANGGKVFPKERVEVFAANGVLQLDNFKRLKAYGWEGFSKLRSFRQNKGQSKCAQAFTESIVLGGDSPIPFDQLMEVSRVCIEIDDLLLAQ